MVNQVVLVGRLGAAPETRTSQGGSVVCKFPLATDRYVKGEKTTSWHRVVTFGKTAEACAQYLEKGRLVYLSGRINYSSYVKDDRPVYSTEVIAEEVKFLGGGNGGGNGGGASSSDFVPDQQDGKEAFIDDMPF